MKHLSYIFSWTNEVDGGPYALWLNRLYCKIDLIMTLGSFLTNLGTYLTAVSLSAFTSKMETVIFHQNCYENKISQWCHIRISWQKLEIHIYFSLSLE